MNCSDGNRQPKLLADIERLQKELEQRYTQLKSNASPKARQTDTKPDTAMVIRGR